MSIGKSIRINDFYKSKWTFMVYMAVDNNLDSLLFAGLNEIVIPGQNWRNSYAYVVGHDPLGYNFTLGPNTYRIAIPSLEISGTSYKNGYIYFQNDIDWWVIEIGSPVNRVNLVLTSPDNRNYISHYME